MPYNIDPNQMKQQINSMFGPNAYENRMSQIDNVAKLNAQLDVAKKNYSLRLKAHNDLIKQQQAAAKKAQAQANKKTYVDAVDQLQADPSLIKQDGAYKTAEEIKNDPSKQAAIKAQGYNVSDYINALYNVASNGKFRSEREFNQYNKQLKADVKKKASLGPDLSNLAPKSSTQQPNQQPHNGLLSMIGNEFGVLKKDAGQVIGALLHPTSSQANNQALSNIKKNGDVANSEAQRFANRAVDSASFGAYGKLDNVAHGGKVQSYQSSQGRTGVGKVSDVVSSLLGDLVPGTAIFDAVKGAKTASRAENLLKNIGFDAKVSKLGGIAAQGAAAGGLYGLAQQGTDAALNPGSQPLSTRVGNVGMDAIFGGLAEPLFHVGGSVIGKYLGKTKASQQELNSVVSNLSLPKSVRREALKIQDTPLNEQPFNVLSNPLKNVDSSTGGLKPLQRQQTSFKTNVTRDNAYYDEYMKALDDQVSLLKSQMGKGVEPGGVINNSTGDVAGRYGRVSNNHSWYQDLYKSLGHQPTNEDLYNLASKQLKEGYTDNGVKIPPWEPSRVKELNGSINDVQNAISQIKPKPVDISNLSSKQIADIYNNKVWYHGTSTEGLTANSLDPFVGNHEGLFGNGIYLTDNPDIANGYANVRSKRSGKPTIYQAKVNMQHVLDLQKPSPKPAQDAVLKSVQNLDYVYQHELDSSVPNYASEQIKKVFENGGTTEDAIQKMRSLTTEISHEAEIPTSQFVENYQELAINLKEAGYDGITHTGGSRTGNDPHRVLIALDPHDHYSGTGRTNQITQFDKNNNHEQLNGLKNTLGILQKGKNDLSQPQTKINVNAISKNPLSQLQQTLKQVAPTTEPKVMNISSAEPPLKKLTKSEQIQEQNLAQFKANNADTTIPNTTGHIVSKKDLKATPKDLIDLGYTKVVDNLHPLSKFDKTVEKVTGVPLRPSEKTHVLGLLSRGADQISKQNLTENLVDSKSNVIGKPLKDVTKNLNESQLKSFEDYLVNKHAITRMQRGEKVFSNEMKMSPEKSAQIVKAYEEKHPEFKQLAKEYYTYNKKLGKAWLVDTGLIPKDQWNAYLEKNPHYVPNNRAFNPLEKSMNHNSKSGFANQSNPVKAATGSQRKIISPIESTIEHTVQYVKTAKRNEVMQALIKNITKNPEDFKGWAEIVKTDKTPQSVVDTLNKDGIDGVLSDFNKGFDQKPDLTHGNIVTGIIDGQKVHVRVHDPQLLDALTNLAPKEQHLVFRFFGQLTRVMKNLTTGINPVFSLTRNVFRDIPTSYTNSKTVNNPVKFSKDLISAFIDVVGNREAYQSFKNFGGGHSSPISSDVNLLAQSKRSILKQKGIKPLLGKGLSALENLNNAVESAPRLAEYKRNVVPGNYDSHVQGLYAANDITTNFNKYGNFTKGLDSLVPYLNAAVQGLDKLGRQFKDAPTSTILKATGAVTLPTIVLYAVNHNNPNYQQLSNYVKDNNFVIPLSNGTFYKIPKPRELGMAFSTDIERTLRAWADNDPQAFQGFVKDVIGNFAPPVRTIAAPFNDLRANKNFMGAPIVPGDLQNLSPKYQYDSQTSSLARGLGNLTNKSPKQIDYLIKSYGGFLGQVGIPAMAPGSTVGSTLKNQVIADPAFSNDIMSNFYNEKNKLDMAKNDYSKQGALNPNLNENLRKVFDSQARNISKVRKEMKLVQGDTTLSNKDKQDKIRQLQQIMNNIAQQANKLAR